MDKVPDAGNLFIGGLKALDSPDLLDQARITHVLSVLEFDYCDYEEFSKYKRLLIHAEDNPQEDLLQHFRTTNSFLEAALACNGTVIIHCAMGISRSATVACAYLMYKQHLTVEQALARLREVRPLCAPNEGFLRQLDVYEKLLSAVSDSHAKQIYEDWARERLMKHKM